MKKTKKIRLVVEREVLRVLQGRELCLAEGGGAVPTSDKCTRITGDSKRVCCV